MVTSSAACRGNTAVAATDTAALRRRAGPRHGAGHRDGDRAATITSADTDLPSARGTIRRPGRAFTAHQVRGWTVILLRGAGGEDRGLIDGVCHRARAALPASRIVRCRPRYRRDHAIASPSFVDRALSRGGILLIAWAGCHPTARRCRRGGYAYWSPAWRPVLQDHAPSHATSPRSSPLAVVKPTKACRQRHERQSGVIAPYSSMGPISSRLTVNRVLPPDISRLYATEGGLGNTARRGHMLNTLINRDFTADPARDRAGSRTPSALTASVNTISAAPGQHDAVIDHHVA